MTRRVVTMIMLLGAAVGLSALRTTSFGTRKRYAGSRRSQVGNRTEAAERAPDRRRYVARYQDDHHEGRKPYRDGILVHPGRRASGQRRAYGEVVAPVPGRVSRVLADIGEQVRAGRRLRAASTELGRARAAYTSAQARLDLARAALARKRTLADERIAPVREVQEAQADADAAEADARRGPRRAPGARPSTLPAWPPTK